MSNQPAAQGQSIGAMLGGTTPPEVKGARIVRPLDRVPEPSDGSRRTADIIRTIRDAGQPLNESEIGARLKLPALTVRAIVHQLVTGEARLLRQVGKWGAYRYCPEDMLPGKALPAAAPTTSLQKADSVNRTSMQNSESVNRPDKFKPIEDVAERLRAKHEQPKLDQSESTKVKIGDGDVTGEGGQAASSPVKVAEDAEHAKCPDCGGRMMRFSILCAACYRKASPERKAELGINPRGKSRPKVETGVNIDAVHVSASASKTVEKHEVARAAPAIAPEKATATLTELLTGARGDLIECAEAHSDPQIKALARRVRLIEELQDSFRGVPA